MSAFYNEWEAYPAQWTRNLIAAGHVAPGVVDERSIRELAPADVRDFRQCHFFSGIAVWSYALRLAGVTDDAEAWTGSCPCQPFSAAGRRGGTADDRHLWPEWFRLIAECRPAIVFGEQVASPDGLGWLDIVRADLEGAGYAVGAADLCAAGVGAPHIRQRLFFCAVANANRDGWRGRVASLRRKTRGGPAGDSSGVEYAGGARGGRDTGAISRAEETSSCARGRARRQPDEPILAGPTNGFWSGATWVRCADGKSRPAEPGTFPLAHGAPARMGRLRAYGNAIVPQVAATFIRAAMDSIRAQFPELTT
jgi:DNA (cytosine-5)-methyltransferase 1